MPNTSEGQSFCEHYMKNRELIWRQFWELKKKDFCLLNETATWPLCGNGKWESLPNNFRSIMSSYDLTS